MSFVLANVHQPIFDWLSTRERRGALVHAALDGRWLEATLTAALLAMAHEHDVAVVTTRSARAKLLVREWHPQQVKIESPARGCLLMVPRANKNSHRTPGSVWIIDPDALKEPDLLPVGRLSLLLILGAHALPDDPSPVLPAARSYMLTERAPTTHWSTARLKDVTQPAIVRHTAVVARYPDTADAVPPKDDPMFARSMLCEEREPPVPATEEEFGEFCSTRIWIKSDKRAGLSERQKAAAGSSAASHRLLPFERNFVQRRVGEVRAQAVADGKLPWVIVLKSRRGGITTIEQARSYWFSTHRPGNDCVTLAHTLDATRRVFRMVKVMADHDKHRPALIGDSKTGLEFANGSSFFIATAGGKSAVRGDGLARVHWSEVAKSCKGPNQRRDVDEIMAGIVGAAGNGEVTLESTPNGREAFHDEYQEAKRGESLFSPCFIRWFDDPMNRLLPGTFNADEVVETLTDEERELIDRHGLDSSQIAFRRQAKKAYGRLFPQEMPEDDLSCFIASGQCWFDVDWLLKRSREIEALPAATESSVAGAREQRWAAPVAGREYVVGVDCSEGRADSDFGVVIVLDKVSGDHVCTLRGRMEPRVLAQQAVRLSREYNDALLGIERENHGHAVIAKVVDAGYGDSHELGGRLFHWKKDSAGWSTNAQSRPVMLDGLADALHGGHLETADRTLLDECTSFRLQKSKYEADPGSYDDTVMAAAIAWQMREVRLVEADFLL